MGKCKKTIMILFTVIILGVFGAHSRVHASGVDFLWQRTLNGWAYDTAVDPSGNLYIAGFTSKRVIKVSSAGKFLWEYLCSGDVNSVALDSEGNVYSGDSANKLTKLSPSGKKLWECTLTGIVTSIAVGNDNNIYASSTQYVTKISPSGSKLWVYDEGSNVASLSASPDGHIYIGTYGGRVTKLSFNKTVIWKYTTPTFLNNITTDMNSNVYIASWNHSIIKLTAAGTKESEYALPGSIDDMAVDNDNNIYTVYYDSTVSSMKVAKISPSNSKLWELAINGASNTISVASDKTVYVGGSETASKISSIGTKLWGYYMYYGPVTSVDTDNSGFVYFGVQSNKVVKMIPGGNVLWEYGTANSVGIVKSKGNFIYSGDNAKKVTKISSAGSKVWEYIANGSVSSLYVDDYENVYSGDNSYVTKISPLGVRLWRYNLGNKINSITVDTDGNVYAASYFGITKISPSGGKIWGYTSASEIKGLVIDSKGYLYAGGYDNKITKLTSQGTVVKDYTVSMTVNSLYIDNKDCIYAALGSSSGSLMKFNSDLEKVWEYSGSSSPFTSISIDNIGKVFIGDGTGACDLICLKDTTFPVHNIAFTYYDAVVEPAITFSISTNSISFGSVNPLTSNYDISNTVTVTIQSNAQFNLSCKAQDDFKTLSGDIITIDHLKTKLNSNGTWLTVDKASPIQIQTNLPSTAGTSYGIDFRLDTSFAGFKPGDYSTILNIIASTM